MERDDVDEAASEGTAGLVGFALHNTRFCSVFIQHNIVALYVLFALGGFGKVT